MEKITKIDVARRQIDQAIRLFFDGGDSVSIHTIASAAAQVVADLGRPQGLGFTRNKAVIKPDRWKGFRELITKYEVFFKHADQNPDPNATLEFHPEISELTLFEAIDVLWKLTGKLSYEAFWFTIWMFSNQPDLLLDSPFRRGMQACKTLVEPLADVKDRSLYAGILRQPKPAGFPG
jgi:hypothetical protein